MNSLQVVSQVDSIKWSNQKANTNSFAVALSHLTGTVWSGYVSILDSDLTLKVTIPTPSGNSDIDWLAQDRVITATDEGSLNVWSLEKNYESQIEPLASFDHEDILSSVAVNPSAPNLFLSASWNSTINLWDSTQSSLKEKIKDHSSAVHCVRWSNTATTVFGSSSQDSTAKLWDQRDLKKPTSTIQLKSPALSLDWNYFSDVFAVGCSNGSFQTFDLRNLSQSIIHHKQQQLTFNISSINALSFSPHSQEVLAVASDTSVTCFSLSSGQPSLIFEGKHQDSVRTVNWSHHKQGLLASGSWDKTVTLHDVPFKI